MSEPTVVPLGGGRYQIVGGLQRRVAYAVAQGSRTWVFLDGRVHVVDGPAVGPPEGGPHVGGAGPHVRHRSADEASLAAPMPATVLAINVAPGQTVSRGDVLVMLEAMKMELAIKAPRDARVTSIACRVGELVQPGVPLVELE